MIPLMFGFAMLLIPAFVPLTTPIDFLVFWGGWVAFMVAVFIGEFVMGRSR